MLNSLAEWPWITIVAFFVLLIGGPVLGAWLKHRKQLALVLLILWIVLVLVVTWWPTGETSVRGCVVDPFVFPSFTAIKSLTHVVFYAPLTLLAGVYSRHPAAALVLAGTFAGILEVAQMVVPFLGGICETNVFFANLIGAVLGTVLAYVALYLAERQEKRNGTYVEKKKS